MPEMRLDHIALMVEDIRRAVQAQLKSLANKASMVIVVSGHGGNNLLKDEESRLSKELGLPFHYIPPFPGGSSIKTRALGRIEVTHADDGEHSVGLRLGVLDRKKLKAMNAIAAQHPAEALKKNPAIMGLGFYALPELGGKKYEDLRRRHPEMLRMAKRFVDKDRVTVADSSAGEELMQKNLRDTVRMINKLIRRTAPSRSRRPRSAVRAVND